MFCIPELGGWEPPWMVGNLKVPHLFGVTRLRGYAVTRIVCIINCTLNIMAHSYNITAIQKNRIMVIFIVFHVIE